MSFMRVQIEKHLPLRTDEKHFSKTAARIIFRGGYIFPSKISQVELVNNGNRETKEAFPYRVKVTRQYKDGIKAINGDEIFSGEIYRNPTTAVAELSTPQALNRATRVERVARRLKTGLSIATVAFAGLGIASVASVGNSSESYTIAACDQVLTGDESLVPIERTDVSAVQQLGITVCKIGQFDYQVGR